MNTIQKLSGSVSLNEEGLQVEVDHGGEKPHASPFIAGESPDESDSNPNRPGTRNSFVGGQRSSTGSPKNSPEKMNSYKRSMA
jgi:hypothetical protein